MPPLAAVPRALMFAVLLGGVFVSGYVAVAQNAALPNASAGGRFGRAMIAGGAAVAGDPGSSAKSVERRREGTRITDEVGTFQPVGGQRVAFLPAGNRDSYRVLENLALERVSRALDESRGQRQWVVSGVLTEFQGSNFLLVTKAVIQLQEGDTGIGP
jgi:hypothetical protein